MPTETSGGTPARSKRRFGHIPGVPVGTVFQSRAEAAKAGIHRPLQAGIAGSSTEGAESIVVSGGYIDDQDFGTRIIYTGQGGNDSQSRRQVGDQLLERGNLALAISCDQQLPVRVIRGSGGDPLYAPASGYRYDGQFRVLRYWPEIGVDGFRIWRYELQQIDDGPIGTPTVPDGTDQPGRRTVANASKIIRDTSIAQWVKQIHDWTCQLCSVRIETPAGAYAEAAHIRPLGSPHDGPDQVSNVLCLCPNCHKRFDTLAWHVNEDQLIVDVATGEIRGELRTHPNHVVDEAHLEYHRQLSRLSLPRYLH